VRAAGEIEGQSRLEVGTRYDFDFDAGKISISSEVRNAGPKEIAGLSFSLGANFIQNLNFSPYNARLFPELNFRVYQRPNHVLGWLNSKKNSVYPGKDGDLVRLPAGTYLAGAARGPAYTRETRIIEIFAGKNPDANFVVDKAVDTPGLISVDAHMHTQFSDGQMKIAERLKGVAAEGVEVAVATDHNYITDYRPEIARLGLAGEFAVIVGNEVTGRGGNIHYNSYPVQARPAEPGNGAISVQDSTPALLFDMTRKNDPSALIQVNHPRSQGLGYFLTYKLDPKTAAAADAPFVMNFDVMEAMNGARLNESNRTSIEDWFHFLNRGYPIRI
jgi:hypothetical protein